MVSVKEFVFEIPGEVVGKGRPKFTRSGKPYTPMRTRLYEKKIRRAFIESGGTMFEGAVHVDFEAVTGVQASASKAAKTRRLLGAELAIKKPDIDNIEKALYDSLTGLAWKDDTQVVSVRSIKGRYEETPRLIVRIRETTPEEIDEIHSWLWTGR